MAGLFCRAAAVATTTFGLALNNICTNSPYPDILESFNISPESSNDSLRQAMEAMADEYLNHCPAGVTIAVTRKNNDNDSKQSQILVSSGERQICRDDEPFTDDSLVEIASVSKTFTGLVLSKAVVDGVVILETPVNDLLPSDIPPLLLNEKPITLKQLVTHTSGVKRDLSETGIDQYRPYSCNDDCSDEKVILNFIREAAEDGIDQSGAWSYSNFGFNILAYALGRAYNMPFPQLQAMALHEPLGLNNTWIRNLPDAVKVKHLTTPYLGCIAMQDEYDDACLTGAGNVLSSGNNLLRYIEAYLRVNSNDTTSDDPLSQALRQALTPLYFDNADQTMGNAYSWFFEQYGSEEGTIYSHDGLLFGSSSIALFQPQTQIGIAVISNCNGGVMGQGVSIYTLGYELARTLLRTTDGFFGRAAIFGDSMTKRSFFGL